MTKNILILGSMAFFVLGAAPASAEPVLGCFVDTPSYDVPTVGFCSGPGSSTNSASFVVMGVTWDPVIWKVTWQPFACSATSWNWCTVSLFTNQCKWMSATIKNKQTGQTWSRAAQACRTRFIPNNSSSPDDTDTSTKPEPAPDRGAARPSRLLTVR